MVDVHSQDKYVWGTRLEKLSLEVKKAYFAKHRQSNYTASLRLDGFKTSMNSADRPMPTSQAALETIRQFKA